MGAPSRSEVIATQGMAATAHPLATQVAIDILKRGGSAVDAAIAANAALGLMEPTGCGIGGDLFAIVWDPKTQQLYGLNASGRSPKGRSLAQLKEKLAGASKIPAVGSLPVTVPGAVDGWAELHKKFGRLSLADVLSPAITYAERGFGITEVIGYYWARNMRIFEERLAAKEPLEEFENAKKTYLQDGAAPAVGAVFKNPDLAKTYTRIATGGRDAFYKGEIARTIDAYMKRIGGDLRYEDLAAHQSEWVKPLSVMYRGYEVFELGPNTQGVAALQMLKILEGFDLRSIGPRTAEALHLMIEAKRLAFEDRARYYADPSASKLPLKWLLSDEYAKERRALIQRDRIMDQVTAGAPQLEHGDTTYLTVADANGMMVSLIQSNYRGMGSGLVPDGLGFMLQDRGELFSLDPAHANAYAPGKRPFHTIIPAFVLKDKVPWMSFGLMGGAMQPQGHVQVLVNLIDAQMNAQEAGDAPRWRHAGSRQPTDASAPTPADRGVVYVERGVPAEVRAALESKGHRVELGQGGFGGYQAIRWDPIQRTFLGASEMRKDGAAIGY